MTSGTRAPDVAPPTDARVNERSRAHLAAAGFAVLAALVLLSGLALRIWALGRYPTNADETVVALMAREILHGHLFAFYWGQHYGGVEPYVVAVLFALFGQSSFVLGLTPVLLDLVAVLLCWRIGRRLFGPVVGAGAALVVWIWPEVDLWQSTLEYGFRWSALVCGLAALLLALRITAPDPARGATRPIEWAGLGVVAGLGWWATPEIVYYLLPVVALLTWHFITRRLELGVGELAGALGGALVGAAPWWWANLHSHFASLHSGVQPDPGFLAHGNVMQAHVLPMLLGLQLRVSGYWLLGSVLGRILEFGALVAGLAWVVVLVRRREALVLVAFVVAFPLLYALSPFTWYWQDGRYAMFFAPMGAIFTVSGLDALVRAGLARTGLARRIGVPGRALAGPVAAILAGGALTGAAVLRLAPYVTPPGGTPRAGPAWSANPMGFLTPVAAALVRAGARDVFTGYWLAYPLMFESHGTVVASDARLTYARYLPYYAQVATASSAAWLFVAPGQDRAAANLTGLSLLDPGCAARTDPCLEPSELEAWLRAHRVAYRVLDLPPFVAVLPAHGLPVQAVLRNYRILP